MKITFEWSIPRSFCIKYYSKYEGRLKANNRESEPFLRVAGSCNGLVCVYDMVDVYLINPTTRMIRTLTPPQGNKLSVGFGRDVVTGTYKVATVYGFDDDRVETLVFELATNEWRWRHKPLKDKPYYKRPLSRGSSNRGNYRHLRFRRRWSLYLPALDVGLSTALTCRSFELLCFSPVLRSAPTGGEGTMLWLWLVLSKNKMIVSIMGPCGSDLFSARNRRSSTLYSTFQFTSSVSSAGHHHRTNSGFHHASPTNSSEARLQPPYSGAGDKRRSLTPDLPLAPSSSPSDLKE
ncbi:unnamed protein product [Arabis nemorensis]|uniref:F-box associated beta-propeller type 3 domain-containing protein n=1 Tax=Arabis nemorensis TaxID=586526 RepID=A0A565CDK2_9BRAS|nr:unnamed protein product [Arabis nemorensis]